MNMEYQSAESMSTCGAFHIAFAVSLSCLVLMLYIISERQNQNRLFWMCSGRSSYTVYLYHWTFD